MQNGLTVTIFRLKPYQKIRVRLNLWKANKRKRDQEKKWPCSKCNQVFMTVRQRRKHRKEAHPKETCGSSSLHKYYLEGDSYFCRICDAQASSKEEIDLHVVNHEQSFDCPNCEESFLSAYKFACHVRKHGPDCENFRCPLCDYKTPRISSISQHINRTHLKKFLYYCAHCGKGFDDRVYLTEHQNLHVGGAGFVCVVCEKEFVFSRYLLAHQLRYHTATIAGAVLANQCPFCKKLFSKSVSLQRHVVKKHETNPGAPKEKSHLCDYCGKGFATKTKLTVHARAHTGVKPYACGYCEKCFSKRDYLVIHERTHTGERPYPCVHCGKCFTQAASLRIHVRTHTGERPYVCHICATGFTSKARLNVHFKTCGGL